MQAMYRQELDTADVSTDNVISEREEVVVNV